MSLVRLKNLSLSYGAAPIFDGINLVIEPGERLCLIGRNGTGKTTLLKLLAQEIQPEDGSIEFRQGLTLARLVQDVPQATEGNIADMVRAGLGHLGELINEHEHLSHSLDGSPEALKKLGDLHDRLEAEGAWALDQQVQQTLSRLSLDPETPFASLSGGMKRRVLLAQALVQQPDILLLDEPTNHLDIDAIQWLEEFLLQYNCTLVFITHDRAFLRKLATRIIELDRGHLSSWPGNYDSYLKGKEAALAAEQKSNSEFDKNLAKEEAWIRQGIKARRTRNEGRVRALKAMREAFQARRKQMGVASFNMQKSELSGKLVIEAENISYHYPDTDKKLVNEFNLTLLRGDRIGIIGPNGCGKSTLLRLLLGQLKPDNGQVKQGTRLEIAYFDQLRGSLNEERSVADNLMEGSDTVTINGRSKHVLGYLQDFLFEPSRARQPVSALSGGERNRLLLAKLFTKSFNVLVLDEPTNDLDVETLELLEEQLSQYQGTLLLVSHDREFINQVVTSTLVFEQDQINQYVGGYDDWLRQRPALEEPAKKIKPEATQASNATAQKTTSTKTKLSYKDQRELDQLPARIEQLENDIDELQQQLADPGFYQQDQETIQTTTQALEKLEAELATAFARWEELEP